MKKTDMRVLAKLQSTKQILPLSLGKGFSEDSRSQEDGTVRRNDLGRGKAPSPPACCCCCPQPLCAQGHRQGHQREREAGDQGLRRQGPLGR